MIVVLDESVLGEQIDDLLLLGVFRLGHNKRFKLRTRPAFRIGEDSACKRWLARQSQSARERAMQALEIGLKEVEYRLPDGWREPRVILEARQDWLWPDRIWEQPIRLPLDDNALEFLGRALRLLLENGRSDWGFLRKAVPASWRKRMETVVNRNWLQPENGGGIDEMRQIIKQQIAMDQPRRLRTWAMFDSDGRGPGELSSSATKTRQACEDWGLPYHCLQRRTIENYVPREALYDWAKRGRDRNERKSRHDKVEAFCAMTDVQRYHFNMKAGLDSNLADIWREDEYVISDVALDRDGSAEERSELFQKLFAVL